jgi:hypothetical protein
MTRHGPIVRHFDDRERERLVKLFRQLGTDNIHEAEAARSRINSQLLAFGKSWADLIELLGGKPAAVRADLASNIVALGSSDPDERANARRNIEDLLERHRKTWNDLANVLFSASREAWVCDPLSDAPDRVNPLDLIHYILEQYVVLKPHEYVAISLWVLHTHVYDRFMVTPRLALRSPVAGCGKTLLLDVLSMLVARPEKSDNITTAAIVRMIDERHPTLLLDEVDNLGLALQPNGRLRAVFNSGHRKGRTVAIMEGGTMRKFSTFAPLVLALPDIMHGLPRTLNSRTITISMERHDGKRELLRFDANHPDRSLDRAYGQILMWRDEVELDLDPKMPAGHQNRFADNWRVLISIADSNGWGDKARAAMVTFARQYRDADAKILLLTDIHTVFNAKEVDRLSSKELFDALCEIDDSDWKEFRGVRGDQQPHRIKDSEVANMLRDFAIRPNTIWPKRRTPTSRSAKGYRRSQFEAIWRAYCAEDGTPAHASNIRTLRLVDDSTA